MVITIASPDKLSISMFLSFMKFCMGKDYSIGMIQWLWSKEALEKFVEDSLKKTDRLIFSYFAGTREKSVQPEQAFKIIPEKLMNVSNMVVWMDYYSINWLVLKDTEKQATDLMERWAKNMNKMGIN
jgi:hypothetical protein